MKDVHKKMKVAQRKYIKQYSVQPNKKADIVQPVEEPVHMTVHVDEPFHKFIEQVEEHDPVSEISIISAFDSTIFISSIIFICFCLAR